MPHDEIRRCAKKWSGGTGWPKRLEWIAIDGLRGWEGQRVDFKFPIVAVVGENGSGKSTVLQAAASVYRSETKIKKHTWFASDFFPRTHWDRLENAKVTIRYAYQDHAKRDEGRLRKPSTRWLGNLERPYREVRYVDLSRIQPVAARPGYAKIAKTEHIEKSFTAFDEQQVQRLRQVLARDYEAARMAVTDIAPATRIVPVVTQNRTDMSGFHMGSGETTVMELLKTDLPPQGLLLIDEIESSLHPRAQRRLIGVLAERCRTSDVQIILTTHSPHILEELPLEARLYIMESPGTKRKTIMPGVSPQFAMTQMDDPNYPECDIYVEDTAAQIMLEELLNCHAPDAFVRCVVTPSGGANVGYALGQMVQNGSFRRPTLVFVDGDSDARPGCHVLPGGDAPERVVFAALRKANWGDLWTRLSRDIALVVDACTNAMMLNDHHDWVTMAANNLRVGSEMLWRAMCAEWARGFPKDDAKRIALPIGDALT